MASACSSSVSIQKSTTIQSIPSNSSSSCSNRRKGCDTVCSSNSSCFFQKKKPANPLAASLRPYVRTDQSVVRQRVMSAKLIKLRNLQSQLNDANFHLMELAKENRALKTLQKRQDKALNNYEGINADLPRMIKSHEEENRTLSEMNRSLKKTIKELNEQNKAKDDELTLVKDQLKHLTNLAKDKHLEERDKLRMMLDESRKELKDYESEINTLNRKLSLEVKNAKQKLNAEIANHKKCQKDLAEALHELNRAPENNSGIPKPQKRRFRNVNARQSLSMVSLNNDSPSEGNFDEVSPIKESDSDVRLQPITSRPSGSGSSTSMQSPTEIIKARLSGSQSKFTDMNQISKILKKLSTDEQSVKMGGSTNGTKIIKPRTTKLDSLLTKRSEHLRDDFINSHKELDLENGDNCDDKDTLVDLAQESDENLNDEVFKADIDIENIVCEIEKVDKLDDAVRDKKVDDIVLKDDDYDLVNQIWSEEYNFRRTQRDMNPNQNKYESTVHQEIDDDMDIMKFDTSIPIPVAKPPDSVTQSTKNEPAVDDKRKLLAALRDIDNGKSIDENQISDDIVSANNLTNNVDHKKSRLIKELFG